jgi:hypothetical protein
MSNHPTTQRRMLSTRADGSDAIRVSHRKPVGTKSARYLLKCGCCDERLEVYYDEEELEINGVLGSIENWREILLPLLNAVQGERRM